MAAVGGKLTWVGAQGRIDTVVPSTRYRCRAIAGRISGAGRRARRDRPPFAFAISPAKRGILILGVVFDALVLAPCALPPPGSVRGQTCALVAAERMLAPCPTTTTSEIPNISPTT